MKKICFFSGDITRSGGTERVSVMIANQLKSLGQYEILFLSLTHQKEEVFFPLESGIERYALGDRWLQPGPGYLPLIPKLRKFMKTHDIDIIIDIDIVLDVLSVPASMGLKTKVISWEHSNCPYELSQSYRKIIVKAFTKRTNQLITLTPGDAEDFRDLFRRQERIRAIYNPVGEPKDFGLSQRENRIITVARLVQGKGFDLLTQVAKKVLPMHPDWTWMICGDGPEREMLEEFIRNEKLEKQLVLTGLVPSVDEYLAASRLFVLTSRAEGLPMCLLEARTYGLPCISFDIPTGPADIIEEGECGYLIEPFDCERMAERINELLEAPDLLQKMGKRAGEDLEKFYMPRIIQDWDEVIQSLL